MEIEEVITVLIGGTIVVLILIIFIISFFFVHQRRQQTHLLEKTTLKARFEQESLNAKNEVQEATMRHIAQELHDNVGQLLSLVKIQLNALETDVPANPKISDTRNYVNQALTDIRGLSKTLNSENILAAGLQAAIKFELRRIEKTGFLKTSFIDKTDFWQVNPQSEIIIFRIFQETVQNTIKHAKAKNIVVSLYQEPEYYNLEIQDDGVGFEVDEISVNKGFQSGNGLANLQSRADLIAGELVVRSAVGEGTKTTLTIPQDTTPHENRRPDR